MQEFFADTVRRDCYDEKYGRGSKASIMRSFWQQESDPLVAKLLSALVELKGNPEGNPEHDAAMRIVERLRSGGEVEDLEALDGSVSGRNFQALTKAVREAIERDEPEAGLDRLHTFTVKYARPLRSLRYRYRQGQAAPQPDGRIRQEAAPSGVGNVGANSEVDDLDLPVLQRCSE
jgi:hypothetical protein